MYCHARLSEKYLLGKYCISIVVVEMIEFNMKSKVVKGLIILTLFVFSGQTYALRCGNKLVNIGDRKYDVIYKCGEPTYTDYYDQVTAYYPYYTEQVDVWTYNFGNTRFMQELIFRNGILHRINILGYGY
jgi:Protein of unknown function (DUF2845)